MPSPDKIWPGGGRSVACAVMAGQQWVNLFDGKTLNGTINRDPNLGTFVV